MELSTFFENHCEVALAFSGGVDSSYLLYKAIKCGAKVRAYFVKSAFQPQFELDDAKRLAKELNATFSTITRHAQSDGYPTIIDGTNASDDAGDRPGMRALKELSVLSPLRECELSKNEIRRLSKEAGLFTWNKPAYACLATRIPTGDAITKEKLERIERAEDYLFSLGLSDFRVRMLGASAKIQVPAAQVEQLIKNRHSIFSEFKKYFDAVLLDLEARDES
jgi:uncharacterized protein